jgi:hypothetical protein
MFHFGNVYLHNKKIRFGNTDIMNYTQVFCAIFCNATSALYLLEIKMHNEFQVVHTEFLKTYLSVFYKRNGNFLEFFFLAYVQLILLVFWGKYCQIFNITKLKNKTFVGAPKFIEKEKK